MNSFSFIKDKCFLLIQRRNGEIYRIKFSKKDFNLIKKVRWFMFITHRQTYVRSSKKNNSLFLHQYLLPKKEGLVIDHINRDTLDNRRENLRYVDKYQNSWNVKLRYDNKSGHAGVHLHKPTGKWNARITYKGKRICLGHFDTAKKAARVRKKAEIKYHQI